MENNIKLTFDNIEFDVVFTDIITTNHVPNTSQNLFNLFNSEEEILEKMDIEIIERFLRKKKLENINRNDQKR